MDDVSLYINFVLLAIYGRMAQADALMRAHGNAVRSVADYITKKTPFLPKPLHRGMLLDPARPFQPDPRLTFLSWSEDPDVAKWFASTRTTISDYAMAHFPKFRGHIVTLPEPRSRVLFHHSWTSVFNGFSKFALKHPQLGADGARQLTWSLQTQSEVITEPVDGLVPELVAELDAATQASLEQRLTPPWIR